MNQKQPSGQTASFKDDWKRHTVAVPNLVRTIHRVAKASTWTKAEPKSVMRTYEEMVHVHDVYRRVVNGKVTKQLWHRGAKVGVA